MSTLECLLNRVRPFEVVRFQGVRSRLGSLLPLPSPSHARGKVPRSTITTVPTLTTDDESAMNLWACGECRIASKHGSGLEASSVLLAFVAASVNLPAYAWRRWPHTPSGRGWSRARRMVAFTRSAG